MAAIYWDTYSRQGVDFASAISTLGFTAAKTGTRIGFSITRGVASTVAGVTATAVDHAFFGGSPVARPIVGGAVSWSLDVAEHLALAPIFLGEYVTYTSLLAAHSSINVLSTIIPGSSEASFSLASFITLVKREWREPAFQERLPDDHSKYGITQIGRAIVAWVALTGVTQEFQEQRWLKHMKEIHVLDPPKNFESTRERRGSRVRVTSDVIFPGNRAQIISADIGTAPSRAYSTFNRPPLSPTTFTPTSNHAKARSVFLTAQRSVRNPQTNGGLPQRLIASAANNAAHVELKANLRRLSKMVLAGYGGASLLFFGISPMTSASAATTTLQERTRLSRRSEKEEEEAQLATAIDASEAQAAGEGEIGLEGPEEEYSWWDIMLGKHDTEIFERSANPPSGAKTEKDSMKATAIIGTEHLMPRFWVLTDHNRGQIVLVLRGTMSLNEIAVDLTCELAEFVPAEAEVDAPLSPILSDDDLEGFQMPERKANPDTPSAPSMRRKKGMSFPSAPEEPPVYFVHSGMLRMARAMGGRTKPVMAAVAQALEENPDYELVMCGHSLGAGVAALLGLMWADPKTCQTVRSSGLPVGRKVSVYCFAPPCMADATLSVLASKLVTSFIYSYDVVSRVSLDSIRDIRNAALWLCDANNVAGDAGYSKVTERARQWKIGKGNEHDMSWFIAVRKSLEANMQASASSYPPGRILWAMRDSDLHRSHQISTSDHLRQPKSPHDKLRLFEVTDVETVFSQVVFAKDMLSAHMPHTYDRALHDLL